MFIVLEKEETKEEEEEELGGEEERKKVLREFACDIKKQQNNYSKKHNFFGLILPFPGKLFPELDPDGHEGPLKNFKLESSLMRHSLQNK